MDGRGARRLAVVVPALVVAVLLGLVAAGAFARTAGSDGTGHGGDPTPARACSGPAALDFGCHAQRYHHLVHTAGPRVALADLRQSYQVNGYIRGICHDLVHVIGHAAGERSADLNTAYAEGDPFCAGGYYHGVTEALMVNHPDIAADVCTRLREHERHSLRHLYCVHGMGHGFLAIRDRNLPDALTACDGLADGWESQECYGGVFMENVTGSTDPNRSTPYLRPDEPLHPCTVIAARYKTKCYEKQTGYALFVRGSDFTEVFALCSATPDISFRPACYHGLGDRAVVRAGRLVLGDAAQANAVQRLCELGPDETARAHCIRGAVWTIARHDDADTLGEALCAALTGRDLHAVCLESRTEADREYRRRR
jgi:hypothetical protein